MKLRINESSDRIISRTFDGMIDELNKLGYHTGSYDSDHMPSNNWLYIGKNNKEYEAEFTKYSDGRYELMLYNINPTGDDYDLDIDESLRKRNMKENLYRVWYSPYNYPNEEDFMEVTAKDEEDAREFVATNGYVTDVQEIDRKIDPYDECLTNENLCLEGKYGTLADYLENHLDSWYGRLNEIGEDIEELGLDVDEINGEYIIVHAAEPDGEDVYCKIRLGGTERTISLEKFEMLESVRRSKNVLRKDESVSLKEREYVDDKYVLNSKESMNIEDDLRGIYVDDSLDTLEDELSAEGFEYYDEGQCISPKDCGYRIWVNGTFKITIYYDLDDNIVSNIYVKESIR